MEDVFPQVFLWLLDAAKKQKNLNCKEHPQRKWKETEKAVLPKQPWIAFTLKKVPAHAHNEETVRMRIIAKVGCMLRHLIKT